MIFLNDYNMFPPVGFMIYIDIYLVVVVAFRNRWMAHVSKRRWVYICRCLNIRYLCLQIFLVYRELIKDLTVYRITWNY